MSSNLYTKPIPDEVFDYSSLDVKSLGFVQEQTGEIRSLMKRTAQDIIEIGQRLIKVKKLLGHGQYRKWIKAEFNWGKSTANSFENVAKQFAGVQNLDVFAASALYELAAPSTHEAARQEAIALAQAGEKISYKAAKEIKQKYKDKLAKSQLESTQKSLPFEESHLNPAREINKQVNAQDLLITSDLAENSALALQQLDRQEIIDIYPQVVEEQSEVFLNIEVSQSEHWWKLGNHHLYCGNPNSQQFQSKLPDRIALAVAFPSTADWSWGNLEPKINSSLTLFSSYEDVDLKLFREMLRNVLELYTDGQETVLFAFVPDPALLLLAESLDCQCFIAENDEKLCQAVIQAWKQIGGTVD
jgi:hypothetical protein